MVKYFYILIFLFGNAVAQQNTELLIPFFNGQKYGFSNESGNLVIPAKYDKAYPFLIGNELTMAILDGKPVIINRKGKLLIEASTDYLTDNDLTNNQIFKYMPEGILLDAYCLADTCPGFQILTKPQNTSIFDKIGNCYFVKAQNKVFLIDTKGKKKTKEFDRIRHYFGFDIEYCISEDHTLNKFGLINDKGDELLRCTYDDISYMGEGKFELVQSGKTYPYKTNYNTDIKLKDNPQKGPDKNRVISRRDGKFGISDSLKNILLAYNYIKLYPLLNDNYLFWKDDSIGILNLKTGNLYAHKIKVQLNGHNVSADFVPYVPYTDKLAFLNTGEYWILAGINGKVVMSKIEGINVDFQNFAGNIAGISQNSKLGVIDNKGSVLLNIKYDEILCLGGSNTFVAREGNLWTWFRPDGSIIEQNIDEFKYFLSNYLYIRKGNDWFYANDKAKVFKN
jgi:hypothetical protein